MLLLGFNLNDADDLHAYEEVELQACYTAMELCGRDRIRKRKPDGIEEVFWDDRRYSVTLRFF